MADKTKIEWTDATWNPITGCSVVSPGCTNCYAMRLAGTRMKNHPSRQGLTRNSKAGPVWTGEVRFNEQWLDQPTRWAKPRMIFVCAHGDLFADGVKDDWLVQIFAVMAATPQHTFQVLTKRPDRMRDFLTTLMLNHRLVATLCKATYRIPAPYRFPNLPLPNVWLGVSVEDQKRADERIPFLLDTPAALHWISGEPLLGEIDIRRYLWPVHGWWRGPHASYADAKAAGAECGLKRQALVSAHSRFLKWVVAGGESGPHARPMQAAWARSLRDQCNAAETAFNFKQWGEYAPTSDVNGPYMMHVGKREAGRVLDGVTHDAFPQVAE